MSRRRRDSYRPHRGRPRHRPGRPRRRPGRPPPRRFRGTGACKPEGFSAPVLKPCLALLPFERSRKRARCNDLSMCAVLAATVTCAWAGFLYFGWAGALAGTTAGLAASARWVVAGRYFRQ